MPEKVPRLRFHCVTVVAGVNACPASLAFTATRLLSADAPRLPLAGCDRPELCSCAFRHFNDRRAAPRRAGERGELADPWAVTDRRRQRGRRAMDRLEASAPR
jgi:hypothetical protein